MRTGLLDLPNEVLLLICQELDLAALEHLSETNQKFHDVTHLGVREGRRLHLDYLFSLNRISLKSSALDEIFRAGTQTNVPSLNVVISEGDELMLSVRSIYTLLVQVENMDRMYLEFRGSPNLNESKAWATFLSDIFDLIFEKTRGHVTIEGGDLWMHLGRPSSLISKDENCSGLETSGKRMPRSEFQENITERNPAPNTLTKLALGSAIPFYVPFITRTLYSLQSVHIKSLSLHDSLPLRLFDYEYILPLLTLPALIDIRFGPAPIPFPSLQEFLTRHKTIETLDLSGGHAIGFLRPFSSEHILPSLKSLIANPEYLCHFLEPPGSFPALTSVTITSERIVTIGAAGYNFDAFEPALQALSRRPGEMCLTLRIESQAGFQPWLHRLNIEQLGELYNVVELIGLFSSPFDEGWEDVYDFAPLLAVFPRLQRMRFM